MARRPTHALLCDRLLESGNDIVGGPQCVGDVAVVDQRTEIAITFRKLRARNGVTYDSHLEALLQELAWVRVNAQVHQHPRQDDLRNTLLAKLKREIVDPWAVELVGRGDDGLAILDVGRVQACDGLINLRV
jgi:hypothetical protein